MALEAGELVRAEDRRRAADHILIVSVEHPGVDGEGLAEERAMSARMSELQGPAVGDRRERDEVTEARQRRDVAKDRRCGLVQDQDRGLELLPEIIGETVEEAPECWVRPLEGRNAVVVRRGAYSRDGDQAFQTMVITDSR
ncbi:hypothetical protein ACVWYH_005099 [Bradyrhizobium sp. GM24.11]